MRNSKRLLPVICLSFFLSLLPVHAQQTTVAQTASTTLHLAGLRAPVIVRRDERGIPYIEAANESDLYFSQGYVTASDRLWQMELGRRFARGELAEILGRSALEEDKRHRTYGFEQVAEAEVKQASPQARALFESYARGVNAYIASLDQNSLPPEFRILQFKPRPWTPADSLLITKNFAEALNTSWPTDLALEAGLASLPADKRAELLLETSPLDVLVVGTDNARKRTAIARPDSFTSPSHLETLQELAQIESNVARSFERLGLYAEDRAASNNWVVSGAHTVSGKPLLANDPHLNSSAPSIWYMMHLSAPGLRVAGVTSPGLPGIVIGHNERIAWGFTNVGPDVQDLYIEKFDKENPSRYMTPAGWREAEVRHEEIKVRKGFADSSTEIVPLDVTITRHGPIIFEKDGKRYALRWTALDATLDNATGFEALNRARNWKEFVSSLSSYVGPMQNMVYADVDGHIGHYAAGRVPIRKSGDGFVPYDGSTDAGEWSGFIPYDKLPHLFDPPSGIIVTANQRIVGKDYPYFLTHIWPAPYRARRILTLLQAKPKMTADDFRAIQGDTYSIAAATFAREAVMLAHGQAATADDSKWRETIQLLDGWDGRMNADSRPALLVAFMRSEFSKRIFTAALGAELAKSYTWPNRDTLVDRIIKERPREWLPKEFKDYLELLRACETAARETLTKRLGADESKWTWGNVSQVSFPHPLGVVPLIGQQFLIPPFPQNGSSGNSVSVNVGKNVSMRLIADPGNWDKTQHGITLGESGLPNSPHWKDQLEDWRNVTPRTFPFTKAAVASATKETLTLEP
ncbi:MAG: penicillin amidase [Acidobacteriota bacterium]|jgi:penicillin amidase|nr:penicillin amidase [Acidobacteriota bacterium]